MGKVVSIVHYSALPVIGGVEHVINKHRELISSAGNKCKIIAGEGNPDKKIPELSASYFKDIQKRIIADQEVPEFKVQVTKLKSKLKKSLVDSDLIIVHNMFTMHFNLVATRALLDIAGEKRTISWIHDISYIDSTYDLPEPENTPLKDISTSHSELEYVTLNDYRKNILMDFYSLEENKIRVIPNGIDPYETLPPDMREPAKKLEILSHDPVITFPSRLTRRKNFEMAIDIISNVEGNPLLLLSAPPDPHNPDFTSYKNELKNRAVQKNVKMILFSEHAKIENIYPFYSLADMVILTSRMEGFGIPVIESALLRIPSALSRIPPLEEIAKDFENSIFFNLNQEPEKIAEKINNFLKNCRVYKDRRKILSKFSWQQIYKKNISSLL